MILSQCGHNNKDENQEPTPTPVDVVFLQVAPNKESSITPTPKDENQEPTPTPAGVENENQVLTPTPTDIEDLKATTNKESSITPTPKEVIDCSKRTYCPCNDPNHGKPKNYATEGDCAVHCPSGMKCFAVLCTAPPDCNKPQNIPCPGKSNRCNCINYNVTHIEQADPNTCWHAAFMMAFGAAPKTSGIILNPNGKLDWSEGNMQQFAGQNGLNYDFGERILTAEKIQDFLKNGPIFVGGLFQVPGIKKPLGHAFVIGGIEQDCNTGEAFIDVYDPTLPAQKGGVFNYSYTDFMTKQPGATVYILSK